MYSVARYDNINDAVKAYRSYCLAERVDNDKHALLQKLHVAKQSYQTHSHALFAARSTQHQRFNTEIMAAFERNVGVALDALWDAQENYKVWEAWFA